MQLATLALVDPATMQAFWQALITLMIAGGVALQQWNASKGKARGEQNQQTTQQAADAAAAAATLAASAAKGVAEHNVQVTQQLSEIKTVADETNKTVKNGGPH
jgi:hypothetical protein